MSKINYQALREAAEKATKGSYIVGHTSVNQHGNITGVFVCQKWKGEPGGVIAECHVNCLVETDAQAYANAEFIAEVNPATMLALLDEREAQNKCIAELEKIATDYALKFQKAQDALKHVVLMRKSEQEAADNNLIDSECHVAELEEALRDKQALLEASEKRIAELRDWNAGLAQESLTYQQRVAELEVIKSAAEKLVRCKGRYHSEQNYRALAALFGVTVPDLPPLEAESVSQTYKLNELSGNSPVTPDGWISCSERIP
ncbi:ead/Ea22-like family protein, partial [Escherichia coli]|uniref:ead/Ea22-like family protein n=2 Tax=Escherichia coli TaxID=562 RepID=UPI00201AC5F8